MVLSVAIFRCPSGAFSRRNIAPKREASQGWRAAPCRAPEHSRPPRVFCVSRAPRATARPKEATMNSIIYLVGLVVIVMAILSLLGLR
ncbi:MAG: hypothetical protein EKK29_18485 [Hyphomicrobiales bacterium]|nr:MAG: hypothetical protein EKK29_18485 [Hyphomicrobiales bacterium]